MKQRVGSFGLGWSATVCAAVAVGIIEALYSLPATDSVWAALLGACTILALYLALGIALGVIAGGLLRAIAAEDRLFSWLARARLAARAAIVRGTESEEAARLGAIGAALAMGGAAGIALLALVGREVSGIAAQPARAIAVASQGGAIALCSAVLWPALARGLARLVAPLVRAWPRAVSARSLLALIVAGAIAGMFVARGQLAELFRAIDTRPLVCAALLCAIGAVAAITAATSPRVARVAARVSSRGGVLCVVGSTCALWLVALGPASSVAAAAHVYRGRAPGSRVLIDLIAPRLDFDGDGYSAYFGDGDCAPSDASMSPGAREIPGNGRDDDCFDGDQGKGQRDPYAPAPPYRHERRDTPLSFVVIGVDTLRSDHLGIYGYPRQTSPNLDRLSDRCTVFERAYAPSSYTYASVPAILTGKFPTMLPHKIMRKRGKILDSDRTLAELMRQGGYATAMIVDSSRVLRNMGLDRGFATVEERHDDPGYVASRSLAFIQRTGQKPFFLFAYFIGPHSPYRRHADAPRFGDELVDRYDQEIAHVDAGLGPLLERLARPDLRDRVAIVVLADHGEAFGEHGTYYHGHNLFDENTRVPFLVCLPGGPARRLGNAPVSLVDLAPTVLSLAGLPILPEMRGHDLGRQLAVGEEDLERTVFLESHFVGYGRNLGYQAAVVTRDAKLIDDTGSRTTQLFDLSLDPRERRDLARDRPEQVRQLMRAVRAFESYGK